MKVPTIFISYSHKDAKWKDNLLAHLSILERQNRLNLSLWDDGSVQTLDDWSKQLNQAVFSADIAVLLISADYLSSSFILNEEIPQLLKRQEDEGLVIIPVIVRPCAWLSVDWLARIQVLPQDAKPLSEFENKDEALVSVARKIIETAEVVFANKHDEGEAVGVDDLQDQENEFSEDIFEKISGDAPQVFICHASKDGDFAELLKLRLEKHQIDAWIDMDRLGAGVNWRNEIDDAIKSSVALIAVMSPNAKESEYVTYEWSFAWGAGIKIIPIMLQSTQLHPRLEAFQHLDFTNRRARPWQRLVKEIKDDL